MTGSQCDEYLYKRLHHNFSLGEKHKLPSFDILSLYKIKTDVKETSFSPYKIGFNYELLKHIKKLGPDNEHAYREYALPDKTMIQLNTGPGYIDYIQELINTYFDSNLLEKVSYAYDVGGKDTKYVSDPIDPQCRKGIVFKAIETIKKYCDEESVRPDNIGNLLLTGGMLNLQTFEGKSLKDQLSRTLELELQRKFNQDIEVSVAY